MIYLAMQPENEVSQIREISDAQQIPRNLLNKIFQSLVKTGLVRSHRGSKGGFFLARAAKDITLKEIIEKIEGLIYLNKCLIRKGECSREEICSAHEVWQEAQTKMLGVLERTTLQELAEKALRLKPYM
jgi:Rrf2 family protein